MAPTRIMIIRHTEKPAPEGANGVNRDGQPSDSKSLSVIGWQRAQKLAGFFLNPTADRFERPNYVFASSPDAESQRPFQTVTP